PLHCLLESTAPTEFPRLSLHDALPISDPCARACASRHDPRGGGVPAGHDRWAERPGVRAAPTRGRSRDRARRCAALGTACRGGRDRKSTRLNSSHVKISYAVFCLKKKK